MEKLELKKLKVFFNKRNNQAMITLPKKRFPNGKVPKYLDIVSKW